MKYKVNILDVATKEILEVKTFNTRDEQCEFFCSYDIKNKILVNKDWYMIRVFSKIGDKLEMQVSKYES